MRARPPRPVLLALVYGAFLVIVGVTATMQAVLVGTHFSTSALNTTVETDAGVVRAFADEHLRPADFAGGALAPEREATLRSALAAFTRRPGIVRAEVRHPDGTVLVSDAPTPPASSPPPNADIARAVDGQPGRRLLRGPGPAGRRSGTTARRRPGPARGLPADRRRARRGGRRPVARRRADPRPPRGHAHATSCS